MAARTRGDRGGSAASPQSDAYVGLLGISLGALILGCILLFLDQNEYPAKPGPTPQYTALPRGDAPPPGGGGVVQPPPDQQKQP